MAGASRGNTPTIELSAGRAVAEFAPAAGGRLTSLTVDGQQLLAERGPELGDINWGAFVMAPWAGRIRGGRFSFEGSDHELECNHIDDRPGVDPDALRHAIHGTVTGRPWTVEQHDDTHLVLACALHGTLRWPFPGDVRSRIELTPDELRWHVSVSTHGAPFPAVIGWHPWLPKPEQLSFEPTGRYERDAAGLPTGRLVEPGQGPWDDCFIAPSPFTLHYAREIAPTVTISSDCDHWVVFDERPDATCVEPQSGPPDAFNLRDFPAPRVTLDDPLGRTMAVTW